MTSRAAASPNTMIYGRLTQSNVALNLRSHSSLGAVKARLAKLSELFLLLDHR